MSGNPQLVIDTGTKICGMRITESRIIVVGDTKIIAWELPARNNVLKAHWNIDNSIWTIALERIYIGNLYASISPDFNHIALVNTWGLRIDTVHFQHGYWGASCNCRVRWIPTSV